MRRRLLAFRVVAVAVGIAAAVAAAEIALRARAFVETARRGGVDEQLRRSAEADVAPEAEGFGLVGLVEPSRFPDVVYELKPGLRGTFMRLPLEVSSHGMRDREYPLAKPPGTFRIAGLGDSVMFGWGVRAEESYLEVLERRLNEMPGPHPRFEVLNFAVPGYNTAVEAAVFERKAAAFSPDLVVIHFVGNDMEVPSFLERPEDGRSLARSYLLDFVRGRLGAPEDASGLVDNDLRGLGREEQSAILAPYRYMAGAGGYRRAMERLHAATSARGIPVVVLVGRTSRDQRNAVEGSVRRLGFRMVHAQPYTTAWLEANRIGPTREDRARALSLLYVANDPHPNAAAHAIYAEALFDELRKMGIARSAGDGGRPAAGGAGAGRP